MNQKIKFPRSEKVYLPGTLFPELRVAMRKVEHYSWCFSVSAK